MILFFVFRGEWGRRGPILKVKRMRHMLERLFCSLFVRIILLFFTAKMVGGFIFSLLVPVAGGAAVFAVLGNLEIKTNYAKK